MKKLLIYGSKEYARVVKDLAITCNLEFAGYIDDYSTGPEIVGDYEYVVNNFLPSSYDIVIAIGYNDLNARWSVYRKVLKDGYSVPVIIHPNAYVRDRSKIRQGSIIMAGAIVDVNVELGELCVLWPGVVVNHDSIIGPNTFLSPNCTVCGCVKISGNSFIGAGSVIVDHVIVPPESFVKAGEVFTGTKLSKRK
ncbi:MAG: hypothetical protein A2W05_05365 [Candidatus Schekmanbacteria bacterium RBG_16_38_10]|uniref:PglD N-terminal domain-containing protein n=1 Tax=Candidatus Schekmanbacteria bacterium RBG_16_38_10 TaxID=1817879 RepID=A0A1F7RZ32_9BACT|nr:MAG: hypothetical protein A2W05_05365 [Candidatus Schekmanbacteria bacterium RBG_16_38_10]